MGYISVYIEQDICTCSFKCLKWELTAIQKKGDFEYSLVNVSMVNSLDF